MNSKGSHPDTLKFRYRKKNSNTYVAHETKQTTPFNRMKIVKVSVPSVVISPIEYVGSLEYKSDYT